MTTQDNLIFERYRLRDHLDGQARRDRRRQHLSPHLFDQETQ